MEKLLQCVATCVWSSLPLSGLEYQQLSRSLHTFCRASAKVPGSKSDAEEEGESAGSMAREMWRYHNIYIVVQQKCQRESFYKSGSKATAIRKSDGMTVCEDWAHIPLALLVILWHREKTCLWVVGSNESKESFRSILPEFRQNHGRRNLYVSLSYDISMRWVL